MNPVVDLQELKRMMDEYLLSLDDDKYDEIYATYRAVANSELTQFIEWLQNREQK